MAAGQREFLDDLVGLLGLRFGLGGFSGFLSRLGYSGFLSFSGFRGFRSFRGFGSLGGIGRLGILGIFSAILRLFGNRLGWFGLLSRFSRLLSLLSRFSRRPVFARSRTGNLLGLTEPALKTRIVRIGTNGISRRQISRLQPILPRHPSGRHQSIIRGHQR